MLRNFALVTLMCLFVFKANAETSLSWNFQNRNFVNNSDQGTLVLSVVATDSGKQVNLGIGYQSDKSCYDQGFSYNFVDYAYVVDGQIISAKRVCVDGEGFYAWEYRTRTEAGKAFLLKKLMTKDKALVIEVDGKEFWVPTKGFNAIWNSLSEEAL